VNNKKDFKITGDKKAVRLITKFLLETDIGETIIDLATQTGFDAIVYGYLPWDYAKEFELNLKEQGFLKSK